MRRLDTEPVAALATERTHGVEHGPGWAGSEGTRTPPPERLDEIVVGRCPSDYICQALCSHCRGDDLSPGAEPNPRKNSCPVGPDARHELARSVELLWAIRLPRGDPGDTAERGVAACRGSAGRGAVGLEDAAALGPSPAPALARAWGGDSVAPIQAAIAGGFPGRRRRPGALRCSHPLLASAALAQLDPLDREASGACSSRRRGSTIPISGHVTLRCPVPSQMPRWPTSWVRPRCGSRRGASALAADWRATACG